MPFESLSGSAWAEVAIVKHGAHASAGSAALPFLRFVGSPAVWAQAMEVERSLVVEALNVPYARSAVWASLDRAASAVHVCRQ